MKLFKQISSLRQHLAAERQKGKQIGFVPTMGALHKGHLSLISSSRAQNDLTVCSIFVNPTQFNSSEDLSKYPRTIENDIKLLIESGCNILFHPEVNEMYSSVEETRVADYGLLTSSLEGQFRLGHFDGVITIVKKLFDVIEPDNAYFGQKDYQQAALIGAFIQRNSLKIKLHICPTLRDSDGLALSSRNVRLSPDDRKDAVSIPQLLFMIKENYPNNSITVLKAKALDYLSKVPSLTLEYFEIADSQTLEPLKEKHESGSAIALIAAWCGNVRLIDNLLLS